jgi:hypothetical protein
VGEAPYVDRFVVGTPAPARYAAIALYSRANLLESGDRADKADWQVASLIVSPDRREAPMHPATLERNANAEVGGTKGDGSYARARLRSTGWWSRHAKVVSAEWIEQRRQEGKVTREWDAPTQASAHGTLAQGAR